jgi:AcrR family transcriptional regulator
MPELVDAIDEGAPSIAAEKTRRRLTGKQGAVVERLVDAAAQEARLRGYDGTTVRSAAKRAGVAPATAYTYFASKDHLLAEVLWRRMRTLPRSVIDPDASALDRVARELRVLGLFMADDTTLAAACTAALLGSGPDVTAVRERFGSEVNARLALSLGDNADHGVLRALDLAWSGAMLWAGMGHMAFTDVPDALIGVASLLLRHSSLIETHEGM